MEFLNIIEVSIIVTLQHRFPPYFYYHFVDILSYADPLYSYYFMYPLVSAITVPLGHLFLESLILCEWSVLLLKCAFPGDRPYWWVHESAVYLKQPLPYLKQYPLTCETGPSNPSYVTAMNVASVYVLSRLLTSRFLRNLPITIRQYHRIISRLVWTGATIWIGLIMVSQMFIATHFPHQCLLGAVIGLSTAYWAYSKGRLLNVKRKQALMAVAVMLSAVGAAHGIRRLFGGDSAAAIKKGIRWCASRDYIQIDEAPFSPSFRLAGLALGFGLSVSSSMYSKCVSSKFSWKMRTSLAILGLATGQSCYFVLQILPVSNPWLFYPMVVVVNLLFSGSVGALLPRFVMASSRSKQVTKPDILKQQSIS